MAMDKRTVMWRLVSMGAAAAAGAAAQRTMTFAWTRVSDRDGPPDPASRDTPWPEAIAWAVATGVGFGVARMLANRSASAVWELATDAPPPDS